MANTKEYKIVINGLTESISAVESLNKQLDNLDKKIKALSSKAVNVSSGGGSKSSSTSSLSEEEKLEKQIVQLQNKKIANSKEIYQNYLKEKEALKEIDNIQKQAVASERLSTKNYANTINGLKQELSDIKSAMQNVDLGDNDQMKKLVDRANELNNKLKEIEQSYGQYGRSVGAYANGVAEGLNKVRINVGGTVREFDSAKQASRTLGNELKTMAANGQTGTKAFRDLRQAVNELESKINDAKKPMDSLMDSMQSVVAIANVGQGIRGLFGINDAEIQKSIKNLVALQNILKGIETINKQIQTREGIGAWIVPFNTGIDKATTRLLVFNRALFGTGKVAKTAAVGINLFSKALKVAFSAGILIAVDLLVEKLMDLVESFKKVDDAADDAKEAQKDISKAYAEGSATLLKYQTIAKSFNGTKEQEKKLVDELNSELGSSLGTYKSLAEWMDVLTKKGDDYIKMLVLQAKAQAAFNNLVKAREKEQEVKEMSNEDYETFFDKFFPSSWTEGRRNNARVAAIQAATAYTASAEEAFAQSQKEVENFMKTHGIGNYAPTIKENGKKSTKAAVDVEKELIQLRIANMKEGLNKTITQLEEERKQKLAKIYADGRLVKERELELNKYYNKKIEDAYKEHAKNVEETYRNMWNNIMSYNVETSSKAGEYITSKLEYNRKNLEYKRSALSNPENSSYGVQGINQLTKETRKELQLEQQNNKSLSTTYRQRIIQVKDYWDERIKMEHDAADKNYLAQVALENERFSAETRANKEHYEKVEEDLKNNIGVTINDVTEAQALLLSNRKAFQDRETILIYNHEQKIKNLYEEGVSTIQSITAESYRDRLQELRDFQTAIANLEAKQPVFNNWGIINLSETKKNNENLLNAYRNLADDIVLIKKDLQEKLDAKLISFDDFQQANRELDTFADSVGQKMDKVKYELSLGAQIGTFIQSINQYVQAGLQAVQTVLNAVDEYNSAMLDKEQETLDKENEALDKKLDEQEDIINKHKSAIDSIEDELANSRGDRRQHLIDQLNAEMEAERRAAAEKKSIEKEQEALEKRQQDIDRKRKEAEYHRNINSIIVSNAMAVANGYAQQPFMPVGLAMGTLALALGAVQLALAKAAKPYAFGGQLDGGQIVGNRHRDGGVKVLGGRAEVEGGEYITNRLTTAKNLDLLEYVNSKKKRIDISDMLEFYNGGRVKTSIQKVRTKFEDGGYIAPLPDTIDIKEQLQNIVVNQDNRPIYVSVVDINNKQADVRRVQTLAGLSE